MRYVLDSSVAASVCDGLSREELRLLRDSFVRLDTDGDGVVCLRELEEAFGEDTVAAMLPRAETLSFAAYLELFSRHVEVVRRLAIDVSLELSDDEMRLLETAFDNIDVDGDGFVDEEELCVALTECLNSGGFHSDATLWLTGVIMARVGRHSERRFSASDFICALQRDDGVIPTQLLSLRLKSKAKQIQQRPHLTALTGLFAPPRGTFSPYEVLLILRVVKSISSDQTTILTAAQFCASLADGFLALQRSLSCIPNELALYVCRRALLLAPHEEAVGAIDCKHFFEIIVKDPGSMRMNVPSPSCRLESSMRRLGDLSHDVGRHFALCLLSPDPNSYAVEQLDEFPERLRTIFPKMNDEALYTIARCCTAAAEVTHEGMFSIQRVVRRLTIRFCVMPKGYSGGLWRRLSPLERCRIRFHLASVSIDDLYMVSRERAQETLRMALASTEEFWDQEHVASAVASRVASMIFVERRPPEEVRRVMAQEAWPLSSSALCVGDPGCRLGTCLRMTAVNLGAAGLSAVAAAIAALDTAGDGRIGEAALLSALRGVVRRLRPCWSDVRVDEVACDVVMSCEVAEGGDACVDCSDLLLRLREIV